MPTKLLTLVLMGYRARVQDMGMRFDETGAAPWARIESARQKTSATHLLGAVYGAPPPGTSAVAVAKHLASFGKRHRLSLGGIKIRDLINEGRR